MIGITDIVRCVKPFWDEDECPFTQPKPDKNRLFIVSKCDRSGCEIIDIETGHCSAWWRYEALEKVRDGSFEELHDAFKIPYGKNNAFITQCAIPKLETIEVCNETNE